MTLSPSPSSLDLAPLELFRQPLVVLCLADGLEYLQDPERDLVEVGDDHAKPQKLPGLLGQSVNAMRAAYTSALITQLIMCDCADNNERTWIPDDALYVSSLHHSSNAAKTAMCDVTSKFLAAMSLYAGTIQLRNTVVIPAMVQLAVQDARPAFSKIATTTVDHNSTPMSPELDDPRRSSSSRRPDYAVRSASPSIAGDSRPNSPPSRNNPPAIPDIPSVNPKKNVWKKTAKTRTAVVPVATKDRGRRRGSRSLFPGGASSSEASTVERERNIGKMRIGIVIGTINLMLGRWPDAWKGLLVHTASARALSDWLWHAKGLETVLVCMLMFSWAGHEYAIPAMSTAMADKRPSVSVTELAKDLLTHLGPRHETHKVTTATKLATAVHDLVSTIFMYYERAKSHNDDPLPSIARAEMFIRLSKLTAHVTASGGELSSDLLDHLVMGSTYNDTIIAKLSANNHIVRPHIATIVDHLFKAYPDPSTTMELPAKVMILAGMSAVLSLLSLDRKRAMILKVLITSLVPALYEARKLGAAEMGMHPAASITLGAAVHDGDVTAGDVAVQEMLKGLLSIYGIPNLSRADDDPRQFVISTGGQDQLIELVNTTALSARGASAAAAACGLSLKLDFLRACIDFCEALPDLNGIMHWTATLLRVAGPGRPIPHNSRGQYAKLATEEQIRHVLNIARAGTAAVRQHPLTAFEPDYWDDYLVRNVELLDAPGRTRGVERAASRPALIHVQGEPFDLFVTMQNPYDFEISLEHLSFLTSGGLLDVKLGLPVLGPLRLQQISCQAVAKNVGTIRIHGCIIKVAGCSSRIFPVYSTGLSPEQDLIRSSRGTRLQARDTRDIPTTTVLTLQVVQPQPRIVISSNSLLANQAMPQSAIASLVLLEGERKTFTVRIQNESQIPAKWLAVSYLDDRMVALKAQSAELSNDTGKANKTNRFRSIANMQAQIHDVERELHDSAQHSGESALVTWRRLDMTRADMPDVQETVLDTSEGIAAGSTATFEISILGCRHLSRIEVCFDAAAEASPAKESQHFGLGRQARIPLQITVNPTLAIRRLAIMQYPRPDLALSTKRISSIMTLETHRSGETSALLTDGASGDLLSSDAVSMQGSLSDTAISGRKGREDKEEYCILELDLVNTCTRPLEVTMSAKQDNIQSTKSPQLVEAQSLVTQQVHRMLSPNHIGERVLMLLPRMYIPQPYARIPPYNKAATQFVVERLDPAGLPFERADRERFWLREKLLASLKISWSDPSSSQHGILSNRDAIPRLIEETHVRALKLDDLKIILDIVDAGLNIETKPGGVQEADTERFLTLRTRIFNRSPEPIRAILRLHPAVVSDTPDQTQLHTNSTTELSRTLLYSGQLQRRIPLLQPHQTVTLDLPFTLLSPARMEWRAIVEELAPPTPVDLKGLASHEHDPKRDAIMAEAKDVAGRRDERRVWIAEGCIVRARTRAES